MEKSRTEYEELIRNSILFTLDRKTQSVLYKREALKMVEYLYLYLISINAEKYSEYGLEITQTAKRCIENYNPEAGDFLNYFNVAIAKEYRKSYVANYHSEQHGGIHIPEQIQRKIKKIIKLAERQGVYELSQLDFGNMSEILGVDEKEVKEYIKDYENSFVVADTFFNETEEKTSLFDLIASNEETESFIESVESVLDLIKQVEERFLRCQQRQKNLLSKLLTSKLALDLIAFSIDEEICKMQFWDNNLYKKIKATGNVPTAREIGLELGLSEQSVSRAYKNFIKYLN